MSRKKLKGCSRSIHLSHEEVEKERAESGDNLFRIVGNVYVKIDKYLEAHGKQIEALCSTTERPGVESLHYAIYHFPKSTVFLKLVEVRGGVEEAYPGDRYELKARVVADNPQMASSIARRIKSLDKKLEEY